MIVVGIYAGVQFFISFLMRIPACHTMTNQCDHWPFIRFIKWMRQVFLLLFLLAKLFLLCLIFHLFAELYFLVHVQNGYCPMSLDSFSC